MMAEADPSPGYRCLLCTKPYVEPRILHCGHSFCCRCLTSYIEEEHVTADEDRHYFPCPVCDAPMAPDDVSADVSTWAAGFPINHLFIARQLQTSKSRYCASCLRGKEYNPAEVWCPECSEMLCHQCRLYHNRIKVAENHQLKDNIEGFSNIKVSKICPKHNGKLIEVFCLNHSVMCCSICVSLTHRECNDIKPIDDVVEKTMADQSNSSKLWQNITEETEKITDEDDSAMSLLSCKEKEVSVEVTKNIQKAKDKLDSLHNIVQSDLADKCNTYRKQISARQRHVKKFHINAENCLTLMTCLEKQCSDQDLFIMQENTKHQITSHFRRLEQNTKKKPNMVNITLNLGTIIDEIMKVKSIGHVNVTPTITSTTSNAISCIGNLLARLNSTPSTKTFAESNAASDLVGSLQKLLIQPIALTGTVDVWTGSVTCVQTVPSSTIGGPNEPWLTGGIFTGNNELLIADFNNSNLLLFDDTYFCQKKFEVNGKPTDVARGHAADEVFVAVAESHVLRCTLRDGQFSVISEICSPCGTWGIAISGDNIMVGTSNSVKVMSMDGNVTKSINKSGTNTCLNVSKTKAKLYHRDSNDVVCRQLDSYTEVFRYREPGLTDPKGIGLDRDDNVYVCGKYSGNVYLVSPDGSRGRLLLSKLSSIVYPYGISVHPSKQEFVVTSWHESTTLEVYRFCANEV